MSDPPSSLPYRDAKPVGAADFYFAINATFRFILARLGMEGLRRYWGELGQKYYAPVSVRWREKGLAEVARYWREFFAAEPEAVVEVFQREEEVLVEVRECPAIKHLRANGREIVSCYCQHCYFVSAAMAEPAGLAVRIQGGNGACTQRFVPHQAALQPQSMADIRECL